jgi:hypothetical protein
VLGRTGYAFALGRGGDSHGRGAGSATQHSALIWVKDWVVEGARMREPPRAVADPPLRGASRNGRPPTLTGQPRQSKGREVAA